VAEAELDDGNEIWRRFLRKNWTAVAVFVAAAVLASISAVLVYLWVVGNAQSTGLVPSILAQWAMAHIVTFLLRLILWEILFIGIPVIVAALVGWPWWRRLPSEERKENRLFGTRSRATSGGGGSISVLVFVAFCIKVFIDGKWNAPIASWTFDYLVYSLFWSVIWILIIFGIPIAFGIIWWISYKMKKSS